MEDIIQLDLIKYPIGPFAKKDQYDSAELAELISSIEKAPEKYRNLTSALTANDLKKKYREGSWNIQQLVHHVADIQLLHFLRMKKALTETDYEQVTLINMDGWAKTVDSTVAQIEDSLIMLEGITKRYVFLLRSLDKNALEIKYYHPVRKYWINQAQAIAMSSWHLNHHLAHMDIALSGNIN